MKKARILAAILVITLVVGLLTGCGSSDTIKIGLIAPLTGDVAQYGIAVKNAVELYIGELNAAGGIDGRVVELVVMDDKGDATEAVNAYNKLVYSEEVVAIIGAVTSTPTIAVAQKSVSDGIIMMTPTATMPEVTTYGDNYFRACFLDPFQGSTMANLAAKTLGAKTAAIIYNSTDAYSTGLKEAFESTCASLGVTVVAAEGYGSDDQDFSSQLTNIAALNPDVIFVPDYYNQVYMIAKQARDIGITATILGVDGVDGVLDIEGVDTAVLEGIYFSNHYSTQDESEIVQNFLANYASTYNQTPSALAALGYDGAMILMAAIKDVVEVQGVKAVQGTEFNEALRVTLENIEIQCVTGVITYDDEHNPIKTCAIIKIVNGKYVLDSMV